MLITLTLAEAAEPAALVEADGVMPCGGRLQDDLPIPVRFGMEAETLKYPLPDAPPPDMAGDRHPNDSAYSLGLVDYGPRSH